MQDSPLDTRAPSTLPLWVLSLPGAPQVLAHIPTSLISIALKRCCSRALTRRDAEAHVFLATYNHGLSALASQLATTVGSDAETEFIRKNLASESSIPIQLLWAVEGSSQEHRRQEKYIMSAFSILQTHEFGEGVVSWPQEDAASELGVVLSGFIDTLDPTPAYNKRETVPEHVRMKFQEMERKGETHSGCGHDHSHSLGEHQHGSHGHGHSHGNRDEHGS
mmetsp:Transcript_5343/g.10185  ORF Transcript_5343/g.10185 Transcript_5343/m.10185 type:complete len:221 (+) Transcript_5343:21-683(+)